MIERVKIKNFKAIQEADIRFSDITAFIGNNGSGKSSVIEALQTLQNCMLFSLGEAFNSRWLGLDNVKNALSTGPVEYEITGTYGAVSFVYSIAFDVNATNDNYFVESERLLENGVLQYELSPSDDPIRGELNAHNLTIPVPVGLYKPILIQDGLVTGSAIFCVKQFILGWQFISLEPEKMYLPSPKEFSRKGWLIKSSGENLADFFKPNNSSFHYETIIEKLRYVLPDLAYIGKDDIEIQKLVFLYLTESQHDKRLPSWLFSSGTLRILTLLTLLNSEMVPPVIFIEEVENGLDPRTLNLLIEEMHGLIPKSQFVFTTHSPYLLDLLDLSHIVVADRKEGKTTYHRPEDDASLKVWSAEFSPGRLYLMDKLSS